MNKKHTKEQWEIQKEHQIPDSEFLGICGEIIQMEVNERLSSHDTDQEEFLLLYATNEQWKKHPMMYELVLGKGLDDELFELAINQTFYVDSSEFKMHKTKENEVVITKVK